MNLTKFGVWIGRTLEGPGYEQDAAAAARLAEDLGFGALWLGGSPRLTQIRPMLAATDKLVVATGIVNIWGNEPAPLADEFWQLESEFPGRTLLGIGIGHPEATSEYEKPLTKSRAFLDGIAAAAKPVPRERMVLAALGPKMLDLSFERTLGAHPYFTPVEHTKVAREQLGPQALIAPELAVVIDDDPDRAREAARKYASFYLRLSNYTGNLKRLGWSDADLADGGSDRFLDALVPQGEATDVSRLVQAHLDAGADHVCVQTVGVDGVPEAAWTALAKALGL